jgi:hypothetical protein
MLADQYDLPVLYRLRRLRAMPTSRAASSPVTLYPGALESFDRALASDPELALAHAGKAQVFMR